MKLKAVLIIGILSTGMLACTGDQNCQSCNGTTCSVCAGGYSDITANYKCQLPIYPVDNCFSYHGEAFCQNCVYGTYYDSYFGTCNALDSSLLPQCLSSTVSTLVCTVCDNGILASNGICSSNVLCSDTNCRGCQIPKGSASDVCVICNDNFMLLNSGGTPVCVSQTTKTANCVQVNANFTCTGCGYGFALVFGKCVPSEFTQMAALSMSECLFPSVLTVLLWILSLRV